MSYKQMLDVFIETTGENIDYINDLMLDISYSHKKVAASMQHEGDEIKLWANEAAGHINELIEHLVMMRGVIENILELGDEEQDTD